MFSIITAIQKFIDSNSLFYVLIGLLLICTIVILIDPDNYHVPDLIKCWVGSGIILIFCSFLSDDPIPVIPHFEFNLERFLLALTIVVTGLLHKIWLAHRTARLETYGI